MRRYSNDEREQLIKKFPEEWDRMKQSASESNIGGAWMSFKQDKTAFCWVSGGAK